LIQESIGVADGVKRCRIDFVLFRKDAVGRQPLVEANVAENFGQIRLNTC
jgi:hypothetical protein